MRGRLIEAALADVKSAIQFHVETLGSEAVEIDPPILDAIIAEAGYPSNVEIPCRCPHPGSRQGPQSLGFQLVREGNHIAMVRENPDGTRTPLTMPNHRTLKGSTPRTVLTQSGISGEEFLKRLAIDAADVFRKSSGLSAHCEEAIDMPIVNIEDAKVQLSALSEQFRAGKR